MTFEDAQVVARIIGTADGGCSHCVADLTERMRQAFPEFTWVVGKEVTEYRTYDGAAVVEEDDLDMVETRIEVLVVPADPAQARRDGDGV